VATWKVPKVLPAGTTMLTGTDDTADPPLSTASVTVVSEGTAGEKFTLAVSVRPPVTTVGLNVTETGTFGVTVRVPALLAPFADAVTTTGVDVLTVVVATVNVAEVAPCKTVMLAGMEAIAAEPELTVRVTAVLAATGTLNFTVPVLLAPALTDTGTKLTALGVFGRTVSAPVLLMPLAVAVIEAVVDAVT
jgi:hypothetical protein